MKLKDINKIKELITERLDTQYEIEANWKQEETTHQEPMWVHRDDVFEINIFYWTKRETNRGTWVKMPVAKRSATVVIGYIMHTQKLSYDQAYNIVKKRRPIINPNKGFVNMLKYTMNQKVSSSSS